MRGRQIPWVRKSLAWHFFAPVQFSSSLYLIALSEVQFSTVWKNVFPFELRKDQNIVSKILKWSFFETT